MLTMIITFSLQRIESNEERLNNEALSYYEDASREGRVILICIATLTHTRLSYTCPI